MNSFSLINFHESPFFDKFSELSEAEFLSICVLYEIFGLVRPQIEERREGVRLDIDDKYIFYVEFFIELCVDILDVVDILENAGDEYYIFARILSFLEEC